MDNGLSLYLVAFGGLLLVAVLLDDLAARVRVPGILMVLLLGLLIDNHVDVVGTKQITLLNLDQAQQITEAALVLVLFFGGLTTNWQSVRGVIKPAGRLATIGVLMTAALITLVALGLGLAQGERSMAALLPKCLFVGAMVASTDASAVLALSSSRRSDSGFSARGAERAGAARAGVRPSVGGHGARGVSPALCAATAIAMRTGRTPVRFPGHLDDLDARPRGGPAVDRAAHAQRLRGRRRRARHAPPPRRAARSAPRTLERGSAR